MATYTTNIVAADGVNVFYREGGSSDRPTLLLLHGFPTSSHQFRNLIPLLSTKYHVIAPDLPGYGFTEVPSERNYKYTFENLSITIEALLDTLNIKKFSVYVFDYGAPVGFRIALRRPEAVQAIFSQNGNAYDEGLGAFWAPIQAYWKSGADKERNVIGESFFTLETTKWQYTYGTAQTPAPEAYYLDYALMQRPGNQTIQLDLFYDYQENVKIYPQFQEYLRKSQVPLIAFWGKNDAIFVPPGAEAFKKDLPNAEIHLLDSGHFVSESHTAVVSQLILDFLAKNKI